MRLSALPADSGHQAFVRVAANDAGKSSRKKRSDYGAARQSPQFGCGRQGRITAGLLRRKRQGNVLQVLVNSHVDDKVLTCPGVGWCARPTGDLT